MPLPQRPTDATRLDTVRHGQVTVTSAGTPVQLPSGNGEGVYFVTPHPDNTGDAIYLGASSGVNSSSGYPVISGQQVPVPLTDLDLLYVDASSDGARAPAGSSLPEPWSTPPTRPGSPPPKKRGPRTRSRCSSA